MGTRDCTSKGYRNSPAVVLHEEEYGGIVGCGKDHGLVDFAFGGGTVAEVDADGGFTVSFSGLVACP